MKILFIFDLPNWAVHNVGKYWARILGPAYQFTFVQFGQHERYDPRDFDYVLWGHTLLRKRWLVRAWEFFVPGNSKKWRPVLNSNFVAVVHDPCEIFAQREDWRDTTPILDHLKSFAKIAVTSNEIQGILRRAGFDCLRISTKSLLPFRDPSTIKSAPLKLFTKSSAQLRKNLPLLRTLQETCRNDCERFDLYVGYSVMPECEYIRLIDEHNCYICGSWQEGGPLPLMDAIHRGCAVLTTPVGQTDELVQERQNGFFCRTQQEFAEKIKCLASDPDLLRQMRITSLKIAAGRDDKMIRDQLLAFLGEA